MTEATHTPSSAREVVMRVELSAAPAHRALALVQGGGQNADVARAFQQAQAAQQQAQAAQQQAAQAAQEAAREAQREAIRAAIRGQIDAAREAARQGRPEIAIPPFPGSAGPQIPEGAVIISVAFFVMCAVIAIGFPIARAIARRMDKRGVASPAADSDVRNRLERIEQAVDAIAVEVERISEGQRFTTKVIADLRALPQPDPSGALAERAGDRSAVPLPRAREAR